MLYFTVPRALAVSCPAVLTPPTSPTPLPNTLPSNALTRTHKQHLSLHTFSGTWRPHPSDTPLPGSSLSMHPRTRTHVVATLIFIPD